MGGTAHAIIAAGDGADREGRVRTGPDASVTPFRGARPALLLALVVALIGSMLVARPESAQATTPTPLATGWIPNWATAASGPRR